MVTNAQRAHLDAFGFVRIPGLLADVAPRISRDFDTAVRDHDHISAVCHRFMAASPEGVAAGTRTAVPGTLGPDGDLAWLGADPRLAALPEGFLGPGAVPVVDLANLYSCDVHWHSDTMTKVVPRRHVALMLYLDPLGADTGALRVLPGSHRPGPYRDALSAEVMRASEDPIQEVFGMPTRQLPAVVLDVVPGDVIVLDVDTVHASFDGGLRRRLITAVFHEPAPIGAGRPPAPDGPAARPERTPAARPRPARTRRHRLRSRLAAAADGAR